MICHRPQCNGSARTTTRADYLLISSLQLHMLELPETAHGLHLLQVSVEGQAAQAEAVAAVANSLQSLHLFNNGRHGYGWWYCRWGRFSILLSGK